MYIEDNWSFAALLSEMAFFVDFKNCDNFFSLFSWIILIIVWRDVFNEKPSKEDIISATEEKGTPRLYTSATIHTTMGDIHVELYPKVAYSYYNGRYPCRTIS